MQAVENQSNAKRFDGCSGLMTLYWQWRYGKPPEWEECGCIPHDRSYEQGGPLVKKFRADVKLMLDVIDSGHPWWALIMFLGVTIGGLPWFPLPTWKWVDGKVRYLGLNKVRWGFDLPFPFYNKNGFWYKQFMKIKKWR